MKRLLFTCLTLGACLAFAEPDVAPAKEPDKDQLSADTNACVKHFGTDLKHGSLFNREATVSKAMKIKEANASCTDAIWKQSITLGDLDKCSDIMRTGYKYGVIRRFMHGTNTFKTCTNLHQRGILAETNNPFQQKKNYWGRMQKCMDQFARENMTLGLRTIVSECVFQLTGEHADDLPAPAPGEPGDEPGDEPGKDPKEGDEPTTP